MPFGGEGQWRRAEDGKMDMVEVALGICIDRDVLFS